MKSIEEVIKAFEWCLQDDDADCEQCPYYEGKETDCHNRNVDALQYLKEYRHLAISLNPKRSADEDIR